MRRRFSVCCLSGCAVAVCLVLSAGVSRAQPAPQQQTPREQALSAKLIQEINENLALSTSLVTMQQEMQKLRDELKAKQSEPKPDTKKP